jgi:hypothetical protein
MAQAIHYCDRCGNIITPGVIAQGHAIIGDNGAICPGCLANLSPEQCDELRARIAGVPAPAAPAAPSAPSPPRPSRTTTARRRTGTRPTAAAPPPEGAPDGRGKHIAIAGAVAGVAVGLAVAMLVASGGRGKPKPDPVSRLDTVSPDSAADPAPPVDPSAAASPARERLAEIRGWVDGLPERYGEITDALKRLPVHFPGAPEAAEAAAFLAEVETRFTELADAALAEAVAEAKARAVGDKPGDPESVLEELRARLTGTAWFETRGRQSMEDAELEVIQLVIGSVDIRAGKLLGRAEEAFDAGDVAAARKIVDSKVWSKQLLPRAGKLSRKIAATEAAPGVTEGLLGWWKFDEAEGLVAVDSSGCAMNASVNGATWAPGGGRIGGTAQFNGTGGHVAAPEGFADFSGGLTIALWARPTAAAGYARFIDFANGSPSDNFLLTREGTSPDLLLEVYRGDQSQGKVAARGVIEDNAWQHFTATIDPGGNTTIYKDGEQVATGDLPTPNVVERSQNYIGRSNWGNDAFYKGMMDDVRVYDRALSGAEVKTLVSGSGPPPEDVGVTQAPSPRGGTGGALGKGLIGWWTFDEGAGRTVTDLSGSGNNGTLKNVDGAAWAAGKVGDGAFDFDGRDDHVDCGNSPKLKPSSQITISAWVKPDDLTNSVFREVYRKEDGNDRHMLAFQSRGQFLTFGLGVGGYAELRAKIDPADFTDGRWHLVTATYDGSAMRVYKDGAQIASLPRRGPVGTGGTAPAFIGSSKGTGEFFDGLIDDVRIYDRALPAEEVQLLASGEAGSALLGAMSRSGNKGGPLGKGLVGWWMFDEGTGRTAADSSGAGNDGTFAGSPRWIEGHHGRALSFNGKGAGVKFRVPTDLTLAEVTVSLRVRVPAKGWTSWTDWWELDTAGGAVVGELTGTNNNLKRKGAVALYCLQGGIPGGASVECGNHVLAGAGWKHLIYTLSASRGEAVIYVDGEEAGRSGWGATAPVTGFSVGIASRLKRSIVSDIDDVRIYSRALSADEALVLFSVSSDEALARAMTHGGPAPVAVTDGLIAHWRFDEPVGIATATDSVGGHDGKITNPGNMPGRLGKIGGAFNFGGNDRVTTSMPGLHDTGMTWSVWFKTKERTGSIMANVDNGWIPGGKCILVLDGKLVLDVYSVGTLDTQFVVNDDKWHHLALSVGDGNKANKTFRIYVDGVERMKNNDWHFFQFDGSSLKMRIGRCPSKGGGFKGEIDDVRIYNRALPAEEVRILASSIGSGANPAFALPEGLKLRDLIGTPAKDGYSASPMVFMELRKNRDAGKVTAKRLTTVGDNIAASSSFDSSLRKELTLARGYALSKTSRLVSKGKTAAQIEKGVAAALAREKPEVVRICLGLADLVKGTDVRTYGSSLDAIVEAAVDCGAVPVLYTLPVIEINPSKQDAKKQTVKAAKKFSDRAKSFNDSARQIAARRRIPCLDAHAIVNRDAAARAKYFTSRGALKSDAYRAMNASFLKLYRLIEFVVFERGEMPVRVGGGAAGGAGASAAAASVANGGFEEKGDRGFAAKWTKAQWGDRRAGGSVRLDKSNPRTGESALVIRSFGDGSKPGASTTLRLDPGTYEISYWACASVGKSATVGVRFGTRDVGEGSVADEWKRFTATVKIEKKNLNSGLGLWTSTPNIRVWFDDVAIRMTAGPDKP